MSDTTDQLKDPIRQIKLKDLIWQPAIAAIKVHAPEVVKMCKIFKF